MIYDYCIISALKVAGDSPDLLEAIDRQVEFSVSQMQALTFQPHEEYSGWDNDRFSWVVACRRPHGYTRPGWPDIPLLHLGGWHSHRRALGKE